MSKLEEYLNRMQEGDKTLTDVHLDEIGIEDEGAEKIAAVLPNSKLIELYLGGNRIGDEGAKKIAAALPKGLKRLDLGWNEIGDEGAKKIAAALPQSNLEDLWLYENKISEVGFNHFVKLLPFSRVTSFAFGGNQISERLETEINDIVAANKARAERGEDPPPLTPELAEEYGIGPGTKVGGEKLHQAATGQQQARSR
jgi:Ran GTPase-activating protein (RanGAP) involved in mRNA processing and transport